MAISHHVFAARPALVELLCAVDRGDGDIDELLDTLLDMEDTNECVDMWRLGHDVGDVLNVPIGYREPFWAQGEYIEEMSYIEPTRIADLAVRLGSQCEPARWYEAASAAGMRMGYPGLRNDTEGIVAEVVALNHHTAALGAGFIVWHSA